MTTRASIIVWSAGGGLLLGLIVDGLLVGLWTVLSAVVPALSPRQLPRWAVPLTMVALTAVPVAMAVLGYLEGRLKVD